MSPARMHVSSRRADLDQDLIARDVSEAVVDRLEVVEVEQQHRARFPVAQASGAGVLDAIRQERAIGELRQRVVEGLVA